MRSSVTWVAISAALAVAGVAAAVVSVFLRRMIGADDLSRRRGPRDGGWSIVLMVDGALLLATALALALL